VTDEPTVSAYTKKPSQKLELGVTEFIQIPSKRRNITPSETNTKTLTQTTPLQESPVRKPEILK
jgi:hypothetical protein